MLSTPTANPPWVIQFILKHAPSPHWTDRAIADLTGLPHWAVRNHREALGIRKYGCANGHVVAYIRKNHGNLTYEEMAEDMGVCVRTIAGIMKAYGLKSPNGAAKRVLA